MFLAEFTSDRAEDTSAAEFVGSGEQNTCVVIETDIGAILTTDLFLGADDNGLRDGALLDVARRKGILDGDDDSVTDAGLTLLGAAEDADTECAFSTTVIGDGHSCFL